MRVLLLTLLAVSAGSAQFSNLATTHDGARLHFVTSLRQRGTGQLFDPKLFRLEGGILSAVLEQNCGPVRPGRVCGIDDLQVSSNGAFFAYQNRTLCIDSTSCFFDDQANGWLIGPAGTQLFRGRIRISRDGRFLVHHASSGVMLQFAYVHDLRTGSVTNLGPLISGTAVAVAQNGTVLTTDGRLVAGQARTSLRLPPESVPVAMDDAATLIVSESRARRLFVTDARTGLYRQLGPNDRASYGASISADGRWVLYLSEIGEASQLFFSRPDGSDWRQLTALEKGIQQAALSGDGQVAWALTGAGALLRIDTPAGSAREVIGPTARDLALSGSPRPGSANTLTGVGLASGEAAASSPLPDELAGARLTIDGVPMRLQFVSGSKIVFQVPWELAAPVGRYRETSLVLNAGNEFFESSMPVSLTALGAGLAAMVHEDFGSLVTHENPARRGEIVHLYATGLGPVAPPVASGEVTPWAPLTRAVTPWEFTWSILYQDRSPAEVLFVGLAPGLIGYHQIDLRIPDPLPRNPILDAKYPDGFTSPFAAIPVRP